jgi:hypothetical protein
MKRKFTARERGELTFHDVRMAEVDAGPLDVPFAGTDVTSGLRGAVANPPCR